MEHERPKLSEAVLGGGCFWCLEATYQLVTGIEAAVSGYAGGKVKDPTYEQVSSGDTGHAEVVKLTFNPTLVTYSDILDIFWVIHNPTTPGRQGNDVGPQYRSIILYKGASQKNVAESSIERAQELWPDPITTELLPLEHFYTAEAYHQNYYKNHPDQGYCQVVINPKLQKLRQKFAARLKPELT
jgi:peptide-methionine (S)-S-oxide reductase